MSNSTILILQALSYAVTALIFTWFTLCLVGPRIYYRYRSETIINAPIEVVWRAVNFFGHGFRGSNPDIACFKPHSSDPDVMFVRVDLKAEQRDTACRRLEAEEGRRLKSRCEIVGKTEFPLGREAFEQVELFPISDSQTCLVSSGSLAWRDPMQGLFLYPQYDRRYNNLRKMFCETGIQTSPNKRSSWFVTAGIVVVASAAAVLQFGPILAIAVLGIILFHELGHAIAFKLVGEQVYSVRLIPFLGAATFGSQPKTALRQSLVSLGGTTISLLAILACLIAPFLLGWPIGYTKPEVGMELQFSSGAWVYFAAAGFAFINLLQLVPIGFLDGGSVMAAILSGLPRRVAALITTAVTALVVFVLTQMEMWFFAAMGAVFLALALRTIRTPDAIAYQPATTGMAVVIGGLYISHIAAYVGLILVTAVVFTRQVTLTTGLTFEEAQMDAAHMAHPDFFAAEEEGDNKEPLLVDVRLRRGLLR
jgi:Zn-dependent protease